MDPGRNYGLELDVVNPGNAFGPREVGAALPEPARHSWLGK